MFISSEQCRSTHVQSTNTNTQGNRAQNHTRPSLFLDVRRVVLTALERSSSMAWIVSTKATGKKQSTLPCNVIQCVVHSMLYEIVCKANRTSSHTQLEIIQVVDETSSTT